MNYTETNEAPDNEGTEGLTNTSPNAKPASAPQQAQFDLLLGRARQVMGNSAKEWLDTLKAAPSRGAVMLGTQTLRKLAMMSEQAGQKVDPVVLIHVGIQLCKDIAAVANQAGLVSDEQLPQYLKETMGRSMMAYLEADAKDGLLSPQDKQRADAVLQGAGQPQPAAPPGGSGMLAQLQGGAP